MFDGHFNLKVLRLKRISISFQGNDPIELYALLSPTYSAVPVWERVSSTQSAAYKSTSTASFTLANEVPVLAHIIPINGGTTFDVSDLDLQIPANTNLAFAAKSGQNITTINLAVTWDEV